MAYSIGIDLGGTNIAAGLVDEKLSVIARESVKTNVPRSMRSICEDMAALCQSLASKGGVSLGEVSWIGVGTAGIVWNGEIKNASNLALCDAPVAAELSALTGRPVYLQNDAEAAAYGEYLCAGEECRSMLLMTIGTGIGAGFILDGRIYAGFNGAAPEPGHTVLVPGGRLCACKKRGCFETYCSANGLARSVREAMQKYPKSLLWALCGGESAQASAPIAFAAYAAKDPAAQEVIEKYLDYLSIGVANLINILQPEIFCIGGGVSMQGDALLLPLKERVEALSFAGSGGLRTRLTLAKLGNDAGIVGAAMLGRMA